MFHVQRLPNIVKEDRWCGSERTEVTKLVERGLNWEFFLGRGVRLGIQTLWLSPVGSLSRLYSIKFATAIAPIVLGCVEGP